MLFFNIDLCHLSICCNFRALLHANRCMPGSRIAGVPGWMDLPVFGWYLCQISSFRGQVFFKVSSEHPLRVWNSFIPSKMLQQLSKYVSNEQPKLHKIVKWHFSEFSYYLFQFSDEIFFRCYLMPVDGLPEFVPNAVVYWLKFRTFCWPPILISERRKIVQAPLLSKVMEVRFRTVLWKYPMFFNMVNAIF